MFSLEHTLCACQRHSCLSLPVNHSYIELLFPSLLSASKHWVCEMCCTENWRQVLPKAFVSCSTRSKCFPKTSSFILLYWRCPLARWQTFSVNQKAQIPVASASQNSLTFPGSMLDSQLVSESDQRSKRSVKGWGSCKVQKSSLSKLWFLSRDSNEAKAGNSLSRSLFCCSHYKKSTSKESPPLTICRIVS